MLVVLSQLMGNRYTIIACRNIQINTCYSDHHWEKTLKQLRLTTCQHAIKTDARIRIPLPHHDYVMPANHVGAYAIL